MKIFLIKKRAIALTSVTIQAHNQAEETTMIFLGIALFVLGLILAIIGHFWMLINAFMYDIVWGLICFFVPFGSWVFIIKKWEIERIKRAFFLQLAGWIMIVLGLSSAATVATNYFLTKSMSSMTSQSGFSTNGTNGSTTDSKSEEITINMPFLPKIEYVAASDGNMHIQVTQNNIKYIMSADQEMNFNQSNNQFSLEGNPVSFTESDGQLTVNGKSYGAVKAGDVVSLIQPGLVKVNDSVRKQLSSTAASESVPTSTPEYSSVLSYEDYMRTGGKIFEQEDYEVALIYFQKALNKRPGDSAAIAAIRNAEKLAKQKKYKYYMNVGYDAAYYGDYQRALTHFKMAAKEQPGDAYAAKAIRNTESHIAR